MPSPIQRGTAALTVRETHELTGSIPDTDVTTMATDDGAAEFGKHSAWGDNRDPHGVNLLRTTARTAQFLVGHELLRRAGAITPRIAGRTVELPALVAAAVTAVQRDTAAQVDVLVLGARMHREGLAEPRRSGAAMSAAVRVPLFLGELGLVAAAMQLYGLSDKPLVPGVALTDDLHIAALATIVVLNVLGDVVGITMRRIGHAFETRRRSEAGRTGRGTVRGPSPWDVGVAVVVLAAAVAVLCGLTSVRLSYMRAMGEHVGPVPFFCVQLGILVAAVLVGYLFHHPLAREWQTALRAQRQRARTSAAAVHAVLAGARQVAADIDTVGTVVGTSVQQVRATAMHVEGQAHRYARDMQHGQPEPTAERLLPVLGGSGAATPVGAGAPEQDAAFGALVAPLDVDDAAHLRERLLGGVALHLVPADISALVSAIDEGSATVRAVETLVTARAAEAAGLDLAEVLGRMDGPGRGAADMAAESPVPVPVPVSVVPVSPALGDLEADEVLA